MNQRDQGIFIRQHVKLRAYLWSCAGKLRKPIDNKTFVQEHCEGIRTTALEKKVFQAP